MQTGSLSFIGLGLYDEKDISVKGLEEIKKCDKVFAEFYTSELFGTNLEKIKKMIGKDFEVLTREEVEEGDKILDCAKKHRVAFLVPGDPMVATTHVDLRLRAIKAGIKTRIIHGSSIYTAVAGLLGLQHYKFGRTTTIPYPEKDYFPISPYEVIRENRKNGLHTLVLLDIQADKNRYMTANEGLKILLKMEEKVGGKIVTDSALACVVARAGSDRPVVRADEIRELIKIDFGPPLHSIVIPGKLHFMEVEALQLLARLPAHIGEKLQKT